MIRASDSRYVMQLDEKSFCPKCGKNVELLCHRWAGPARERAFYICFDCRSVYEVGKGEVTRE